ncbi:MAG: hypothetical protein AAFO99_02630 [Bacteroidota bacterium]
MKKLLILLLLLGHQIFACSCFPTSLLDLTAKADFIATATILEINQDLENTDFHTVQIDIIELFKGSETTTIKIRSNSNSSCSFYTPKNTKWLIFATKNKSRELTFGYCSGSKQLDRKFDSKRYTQEELDKASRNHKNSLELKLRFIKYLRDHKIEPSNKFNLKTYFIDDCLKKLRGVVVKGERFALYELTVKTNLAIEKVETLKGFNHPELNLNLVACIKNGAIIHRTQEEKTIPRKTKILLGLYYYPSKREYESFISNNAL